MTLEIDPRLYSSILPEIRAKPLSKLNLSGKGEWSPEAKTALIKFLSTESSVDVILSNLKFDEVLAPQALVNVRVHSLDLDGCTMKWGFAKADFARVLLRSGVQSIDLKPFLSCTFCQDELKTRVAAKKHLDELAI